MGAREPQDPNFRARVEASFARQGLLRAFGATLVRVEPGEVEIALPKREEVTQQHGFVHAGALAAIADTAAGFAALSLMPPGVGVLTTEFKINLLAPATGARALARARVVKAGRTLTFAQTDILSGEPGAERLVAYLTATLMTVRGREGVAD